MGQASEGGTREISIRLITIAGLAADGTERDAELAIQHARKAFDEGPWPQMRAPERASYLFKLADLIDQHAEELATMETRNNGKPLREAKFDVTDAAACFRYYAGLITKPLGQSYEVGDPTIQAMVVREPIGVCGQIIPWNYPLLMAAWKLAPGLAAGNCCILKPAEATPMTAVRLFELIAEAGFPPGAAQLLPGPGPVVGNARAASMLVDKVAFTGGTTTGRKIMTAATGNTKKATLELGGKTPNIIFADAVFDVAIGSPCSASTRVGELACRLALILAQARDRFAADSDTVNKSSSATGLSKTEWTAHRALTPSAYWLHRGRQGRRRGVALRRPPA